MPIVIEPSLPIPPGEPGTPPSLRERWVWIRYDGAPIELTRFTNGFEVTKGMMGRGAPRPRIRRDIVPGQPGERTREITHGLRELTMPLTVLADSYDDLHDKLAYLVSEMDPVGEDGVLRRIDRDGNESDLFCRVTSGLSVDGEGQYGPRMHKALLIFQADDPYWYGPTQTRPFSGSTGTPWFPWLPVGLGSSSVIGDVTIINDGDVETWPVWTIIGPATDPEIINVTTGKTFTLEFPAPLDADEAVIIDTRPFAKSVRYMPSGANWRQYLVQRSLWPLIKGVNELSLSLGSTTSASYISIAYRNRGLYPR
jgi:hypothetical protein